jgi:hypothetical protein
MQEHNHQHAEHTGQSHLLRNIAIGSAIAGGAIILVPHILPAIGIGSADKAAESMWILHEEVGSGWASDINRLLRGVPLVGNKLADGGLFNSAATALVGVGGVMLGKFIERCEDNTAKIKWGKVIKYAALATSALIALPTVLTALGSGIIFLASLAGDAAFTSSVIGAVDSTLGSIGASAMNFTGLSGVAATIPHFLTCGVSLLPAALAFMMDSDETQKPHHDIANDYTMQIRMEKSSKAILTITHKDGTPLRDEELAVVHTRKLHVFVVDDSLKDYQHVHPEPTTTAGEFTFSFNPKTSNGYRAWAEFTAAKTNQMQRTFALVPYTGIRPTAPAKPYTETNKEGINVRWNSDVPLQKNTDSIVSVEFTDSSGNPLKTLEPIMGAYAHLVGFSADRKEILHCHPLGTEPKKESERGGPILSFHVTPTFDGLVQFYLQIKHVGKEVFIPIAQRILPPEKMQDKTPDKYPESKHLRH